MKLHMYTMQQTHTHKTVTGGLEATNFILLIEGNQTIGLVFNSLKLLYILFLMLFQAM